MKTFTILGCGWLGLAVAKQLKSRCHFKVSTRTPTKLSIFKEEGFDAFFFDEQNHQTLDELLKCDYLLIAFPPSKFENYLGFLETIYTHKLFKTVKHTLFISSSSIYDNKEGVYDEKVLISKPTSQIVYDAEALIARHTSTIFRCSGLMGENRVAGKYFANKEVFKSQSPVNYVHQMDVVRAIEFSIEKNLRGVFNLCAPLHPSKKEVYLKNALDYGFEAPIIVDNECVNRIIDGLAICKYGFEYVYPNPLAF